MASSPAGAQGELPHGGLDRLDGVEVAVLAQQGAAQAGQQIVVAPIAGAVLDHQTRGILDLLPPVQDVRQLPQQIGARGSATGR